MDQTGWQDGCAPWRRRALSAVALMTIAVAGERVTTAAAGPRGSGNERMACGDMPRPPVRLHLVDRAGLTVGARGELKRETLAPWRAAGATVEWARLPMVPAGLGEPEDVYVVVEADARATTDGQSIPMASMLFVKGQPTTHITVHAGLVARRLAGLSFDERPLSEQPRLIRDRILGRVLGRAVAHEVGHFLSGSSDHADTGLMRPSHHIDHLLAPGHHAFRVAAPATPGCLMARRQ